MNIAETWNLFSLIVQFYPSFNADDDKAKAWQEMLSDTPFNTANQRLIHHIKTEKFPPTIADLRQVESDEVTKYHEHLRQSAQDHFTNMEQAKLNAVPPPESLREWVKTLGT